MGCLCLSFAAVPRATDLQRRARVARRRGGGPCPCPCPGRPGARERVGAKASWSAPDLPEELRNVRNEYLLKRKHFSCTECGKCCTGSGVVWANRAELDAIRGIVEGGRHDHDAFVAAYVDVNEMERRGVDLGAEDWYILKNAETKLDGAEHCIFLDPSTNLCEIYQARPLQCLTFPFWPELLSSRAWREEASVCEGIVLEEDEDDVAADPTRNPLTPPDEKLRKLNSFEDYLKTFPYNGTYH